MPVITEEGDTRVTRMICGECNSGEMRPTGNHLLSHPPQIEHECDKCKAKVGLSRSFPFVTITMQQSACAKPPTVIVSIR